MQMHKKQELFQWKELNERAKWLFSFTVKNKKNNIILVLPCLTGVSFLLLFAFFLLLIFSLFSVSLDSLDSCRGLLLNESGICIN